MPLTTSDTFEVIELRLVQRYSVRIVYVLSDGTLVRLDLYGGDLPSGHAQRADLDVLQEIYASADGFLDADGNTVTIRIIGYARGGITISDIANLEINGFVNPFIDGSYDRLANMNKVLGAFLLEGTVDEDTTTARRDILLKGGLIPETRTPASGALQVSLEDINILVFNSTTFITRLLFSSDEAPTDATLGDSAYVKALLQWLEANLYSGTAVNLTATTTTQVEAAIGGNRVYEYEQADGESVRFSYSGDIVFLNSFREMQLYWTIASDSPGTFNATEFEEALDGETITVDGITDSQEKPPFGSIEIAINALRLNLDRMKLENASDHPVIEYRDEENRDRRLILGYGLSMSYADLLIGTYNVTTTPKTWGVNAIHFGPDETANGTTRMRTPIDQIPEPGNDWECTFHNRNTTYNWEIQDWDGDNLATLLPDERLTVRMTRRGDGTGELIDAVPFSRVLRFSADTLGNLSGSGYYSWAVSRRARTLVYPTEATANIWKMHEECFQFGDSTFNSGIALSSANPADLDLPTSIIFQKPGKIRVSMFVGVGTSGGSGSVPDDHGLAFMRLDGTTVRLGPYLSHQAINTNENEIWQLGWGFDVELADLFLPLFRYSTSTSLSFSNFQLTAMEMDIEMTEIIHREYTP